jgi:hypothetical protein
MRILASTSLIKLVLITFLGLSVTLGLSACGKRGDPYHPSEVTTSLS